MKVTDRDYDVSGDLDPDATGYYDETGIHNGKPYYRHHNGIYYLWWHLFGFWHISLALDVTVPGDWSRNDPNLVGEYAPGGTFTETATVSVAT